MIRLLIGSIGFSVAFCSAPLFGQNLWYVDHNSTPPGTGTLEHPYASLQFAIARQSTLPGDTLLVWPGVYGERIDLVGKDLRVVSRDGAATTIVDAGGSGAVVTFRGSESANCRLEGFTLRNGTGRFLAAENEARGGGIYCSHSSPTIVDCTISGNSVKLPSLVEPIYGYGGGIYCGQGSNLTLENCTVASNDAKRGGGIYVDGAKLTINGGTVRSNRAFGHWFDTGRGGGIALADGDSHLDLVGVDVSSNLALGSTSGAASFGGGLRIESGGSAQIFGCSFQKNDSGGWSMGYGDIAGYGGGISTNTGAEKVSIVNTLIQNNWGNSGGGGIHGYAMLDQCTIQSNHGQSGGGVMARGMILTNCHLSNNWGSVSGTYDWGGGIYVDYGGHATLTSCEIAYHQTYGQGAGGIGGTYIDCDIHDNHAFGDISASPIEGGGVSFGTLIGCRLWNNSAKETDYQTAEGGGLYQSTADHCILYGNVGDAGGGAAYSTLVHCTVVSNRTTTDFSGGGVDGGNVTNSIVNSNLPDDVSAATTLSWSNTGALLPGVGNIALDPLFWNVSAHDFYLRVGSPCIDTGDPTSPNDPDGTRADMGALPFDPNHCGSPLVYCTAKTNSLGCTPSIATNGMPPSIANGQFRVEASNVRNRKNGLLFWGVAKTAQPFQGGTLCVLPPIVRTPVQDSGGNPVGDDCSGSYSFEWTPSYITARNFKLGDTLACQYWSRDPDSPSGTGLTNALEFTWCP